MGTGGSSWADLKVDLKIGAEFLGNLLKVTLEGDWPWLESLMEVSRGN